jgi:hypothetical protein
VSDKNKKKSILIKIYLIFLFICGVAIWLTIQFTNKQKISTDVILDKKIVDILVSHNIKQRNILKQFIREKGYNSMKWNEFYKTIELNKSSKITEFEKLFGILARSMKIGLSRIDTPNGSVTYKFYSPSRTYSNITFALRKGRR